MKKKLMLLIFMLFFLAACQQGKLTETPTLSKEFLSPMPQITPTYPVLSTVISPSVMPNGLSPTPTSIETWNLHGEIIVSIEEDAEIQFFKENRILRISLEGDKTVISPKGYDCTGPLLSPDKKKLLFHCNQPNKAVVRLYLYDLLSSDISILVTPKFYTEDLIAYTWKADSSSIIVAETPSFWIANISSENWDLPSKIYFVDLAKKNYSKLFENKTTVVNLWWLQKQDKILFQSAEVNPPRDTYFPFSILDLEGTANILNIKDTPDRTASISPEGDLIAFVPLGTNSIHIISTLSGDQIAQLSAADGFEISGELPVWSLNEKIIGYSVCTKFLPKLCKVFLHNLETQDTKLVPCKCIKMAWFDGEKYFAYIQDKALFIYSMGTNQFKEILSDNLIWDIPILVGNK